jgi:hypothetical protein
MSWEGFSLRAVEVKGDSKTFEVHLPTTVPNDSVRAIATLAKALEEGQASISLAEINGRLTMFFTISQGRFLFNLDLDEKGARAE